jgi:hypothetical protein
VYTTQGRRGSSTCQFGLIVVGWHDPLPDSTLAIAGIVAAAASNGCQERVTARKENVKTAEIARASSVLLGRFAG